MSFCQVTNCRKENSYYLLNEIDVHVEIFQADWHIEEINIASFTPCEL